MDHLSPNLLAIEIGGTKLQIYAGDGNGEILERQRFAVDRERGGGGIRVHIASALPELITRWNPAAIGVGYGGPVDHKTGQITKSYHISGWSDFPLGDWLRERSKLPCFVDNDANVATLGEALFGAGKGFNPVFYTTLGSGVGGGLVADGRLYHGAPPGEMEIGHLRLDREGTIVEDRCAGWNLDRIVRRAIEAAPDSPFSRRVRNAPPGCEARHLGPGIAAGEPEASELLGRSAKDLAFALSHVVHLAHPEIIVLGGGVSMIGEPLREAVAGALPPFLMDSFQPGPKIAIATLAEDVVPVGAFALASQGLAAAR